MATVHPRLHSLRPATARAACLAGFLLALAPAAPVLGAPQMHLTDAATATGCDQVRGVYATFLEPGGSTIVLATRPFPGGVEAGRIADGRLTFSLPGKRERSVTARTRGGGDSTPVWALLDRWSDGGGRRGCIGFFDRPFTSVDDLLTYVHWLQREVLLAAPTQEEAPSLFLGRRTIDLEVATPGGRPLRIRGTEGATLAFRPPGLEARYLAQPFVLDAASSRVWVKVSVKEGPYYGPGVPRPLGTVVAVPGESRAVTPSQPLEIRLVAISDAER